MCRCKMSRYEIYSWNVNGIRAASRKGMLEWIDKTKPDVLALQETKALIEQVDESISAPDGLVSHWHSAEKKGYSGVLTYHKKKLKATHQMKIDIEEFDKEGRILISKFEEFTLVNCYFPNGKKNEERLDYKMRFYDAFLDLVLKMREKGEKVVICGDVNTAHKEIDLANPKPNSKYSGFLPKERKWIDELLENGFVDSLRHLEGDSLGRYTWWSTRSKTTRQNNVGWRIDYFFISEDLIDNLKAADIHSDEKSSDHCPISITLEF